MFNKGVFKVGDGNADLCGAKIPAKGKASRFQEVKKSCCANQASDSTGDCDSAQWPKGQAFPHVLTFAADERQWLESFAQAWKIATENGHFDLKTLVNETDKEDEYECHKLKTKKICHTEWDDCTW